MSDNTMANANNHNAFLRFFKSEAAGGAILFAAALFAIIAANTETLAEWYEHFKHLPVGITFGDGNYSFSLAHFVNDGLMAVFFLLVGLEIKREFLTGELSNRQQALLPAFAAAGGMAVPALIYAGFNWGDSVAMRGWAIPTATDIAFSLGVLSLLGARVPLAVKVFLTAVAIIDDLGAIAIIAVFYTDTLHFGALGMAVLMIFVLFWMNRHVRTISPYMLAFIVLWACVIQSGIHATLAGVAVALAVPLRVGESGSEKQQSSPPLITMEHNLHSVVTFLIVPLFAFVNAGVSFRDVSTSMLFNSIPLGITLGLLIGKVIGISAAVWLAIKLGVAAMPNGCRWPGMVGISMLCGIGFTVSLFIGNLSFSDEALINLVKIGVLLGSTAAGICGFLLLRFFAFRHRPQATTAPVA
ncbi:MAG: Na+/H+ antiporter NhaA [Proteobacteria bacterium]|nr:Na+/H+ antiporter NhaA [Pseudomonadota bacterium]